MITRKQLIRAFGYLCAAVAAVIVLQCVCVISHELTHSTIAWILGEMNNPLDIIWGNPLTMTGWDENVDYKRLFAQGRTTHAAIIGVSPLIMHTFVSAACLLLMRTKWLRQRKWLFHTVYWCFAVNIMELVAYIFMRSFAGHGDTGIFDRGTGLSPWWLFIIGSMLILWLLRFYYKNALPALQVLFARDNPFCQWLMLITTSFLIFLWGSGIRVMAYVEGPQWLFGLIGLPAFILSLLLFRPGHPLARP